MKDSSAAGGQARRLGTGKPDEHKLPLQMKVLNELSASPWPALTLDKVPQDESWHWHHVGTVPLGGLASLWSNVPLGLPIGWGAVPPPNNEMEVWPAFLKPSLLRLAQWHSCCVPLEFQDSRYVGIPLTLECFARLAGIAIWRRLATRSLRNAGWVSLKFTGPTYVKGSRSPDQVLIDQVVVVPPASVAQ